LTLKTDDCLRLRRQTLLRQQTLETRLLRRGDNTLQSDYMHFQETNKKGRASYRNRGLWMEGIGLLSSNSDEKSKGTTTTSTSQLEGTTTSPISETLDPHIYGSHVLYKYNYEYDHQSNVVTTKGGVDGSDSGSSAHLEDTSWKPSNYPNPITDPERCGVSSLPNHRQIMFNDASKKRLLLCDPDHVLKIAELDLIAKSIWDFPSMALPNTSSSSLSGCSNVSTRTTATTAIDSEQAQVAEPSNNDTSDTLTPDTSTEAVSANYSSSSSASGVDKLGTTLLSKNFAEIQVAVAIVSKVSCMQMFCTATKKKGTKNHRATLTDFNIFSIFSLI
jgi:hypothetical protein